MMNEPHSRSVSLEKNAFAQRLVREGHKERNKKPRKFGAASQRNGISTANPEVRSEWTKTNFALLCAILCVPLGLNSNPQLVMNLRNCVLSLKNIGKMKFATTQT